MHETLMTTIAGSPSGLLIPRHTITTLGTACATGGVNVGFAVRGYDRHIGCGASVVGVHHYCCCGGSNEGCYNSYYGKNLFHGV